MKVTVAIVTRNRAELLEKCLESLSQQILKPFRVIVIDNASTDSTKEIILSFKKQLHLEYFFEEKVGIPYARNKVLEKATGDILAFIDDDITVPQNWLLEIVFAHRKYKSAIAIQGYSINMPQNNTYSCITGYYQNIWLKNHTYLTFEEFKAAIKKRSNQGYKIRTIVTRNCSFKLKRLRDTHIKFNTEFTRGSDTDLGKLLIQKTQTFFLVPFIVGYHWEKNSFLSYLSKNFLRGRSRYILDTKWKDSHMQMKMDIFPLSNFLLKNTLKNKYSIIHFSFLLYIYKVIVMSGYMFERFKQKSIK